LKKVLIIKLGAIGDVVMASSLLHTAREKYGKDCEITWMCGKIVLPLIKTFDNIDKIETIDEKALLTGSIFRKMGVLLSVWIKFLGKHYDDVIIPYFDKRYKLLALTMRTPNLRTFNGKDRISTVISERYFAVEYAKLLSGTDDSNVHQPVLASVKLPEPGKELAEIVKSLPTPAVLIAPAGAKNLINYDSLRRWPIENYVILVELLNKNNITPVLIGSKGDSWAEEYFKGTRHISIIGKTSLTDLLHIYNKSKLLITHDTGTMHLAKLTGLNVITLFGPTNPLKFIDINSKKHIAIWGGSGLYCAPCYDGKHFADCKNNLCMKNITPELVMEKAAGIIL
jgi:heptosyltransferase-2